MAVRCPNCDCGFCPASGPSVERAITYRGRRKSFQWRWRECKHCGHRFRTREFLEESESGQPTPVNPFFTRDFVTDQANNLETNGVSDEKNPFLKGTHGD